MNIEGAVFRIGEAGLGPRDGDVNGDCEITPADALAAFEHFLQAASLDACAQLHADANDPQSPPDITPADALYIFDRFLRRPFCLDANPLPCSQDD